MNLKRMMIIIMAVLMAGCLAGCSSDTGNGENKESSEKTASAKEKGTIAYSCYDLSYEYYITLAKGVKETAEAAGYTYIEHDEQSDEAVMISGCMDLINQGIDALILTAYKPEAATAIVDAAHEKEIPVIMVDFGSDELDYDALIESDNVEGGKMAAEYALELLKDNASVKKKAAIITNDPSAGSYVRRDGFYDRVTAGGYEVVSELNANSNPDEAYSCMQNILTSSPDVSLVFCLNDSMAIAASQAVADAGLVPGKDVTILGFDANEAVFEPIKSGEIACTIMQKPYEMGKMGVETFEKIKSGSDAAYDDEENRVIWAPLEVISKKNVEEYMK